MDIKSSHQYETNGKDSLFEDEQVSVHCESLSKGTCYCGKERNLNIPELLCGSCGCWFHENCIALQLNRLIPFLFNYNFTCKNCSPTGLETFRKNPAQFTHMCITALANLRQQSIKEGKPRRFFSRSLEIIPFIDDHWDCLSTTGRRIAKVLTKDGAMLFETQDVSESNTTVGFPYYALRNMDLSSIRPVVEGISQIKGRGSKRRIWEHSGPGRKMSKNDSNIIKLPAHGYPLEHPFNKDGYRYVLAEPDSHAPFRQEFDESSDWAGKPIPGWLYRALSPSAVLLALHDRAPQLKIGEDRLTVTGDKGYCQVRANLGVTKGSWYWECILLEVPDGGAARIGFSQEFSNLQAPLGFDQFGYSWRSLKGTVFHESYGRHFSTGYGEGDVLGILIELPVDYHQLPPTYKDKPLVKFKNHLYFEDKDDMQEILCNLKPLTNSKITFYKNGICQGTPFKNIYQGRYYPSISLYKPVTAVVNFGPEFKYSPENKSVFPMQDRAAESLVEQVIADLIFFIENKQQLRLDYRGSD